MRSRQHVWLGTAVLAFCLPVAATAADLQPPLPLYVAGIPTGPTPGSSAPPGSLTRCPSFAPPTGGVYPGRLIVRDTDRPDVGPYTVKLPGYASGVGPDLYRPFLVEAAAGQSLRFDFVNQLGDAEPHGGMANLHTHGLITSPRPCEPLGDYVFVENQPGTTTSYRIDIPATLPASQFGGGAGQVPYPPGLMWFHAHLHEVADRNVQAGQAGLLYVGDIRSSLQGAAGNISALGRSKVVYLGLRDIQLSVPHGAEPGTPKAQGARARWLAGDNYDSGLCPGQANPPQPPAPREIHGPGFCGVAGATASDPDTVWMFTVNGQHYPNIPLTPGTPQIWRIANMSSNVFYLLKLVDSASGAAVPLTALAIDGAVAGARTAAGLHVGVSLRELLLPPAARAELWVTSRDLRPGHSYVLRTAGMTTGPAGDPYPAIDLATVRVGAGADEAALDATLAHAASLAATPVAPTATSQAIPANCVTLPPGQVTRRRLTFVENGEPPTGQPAPFDFGLESEVVTPGGSQVARSQIGPQAFPAQASLAPESVPHICARLGSDEVWELVNNTGELHNFHMHQNKFRLARPDDAGVPPGFVAQQDPTGIIAGYAPEAEGASPVAGVDAWHDTLPVPPAKLNPDGSVQTPGRVFVTIPFHAPEQVGDFVVHCHILEHEDGGMMAPIQVFDPTRVARANGTQDFAALLSRYICRIPAVR